MSAAHTRHVPFSASKFAGTPLFRNKGVVEVMVVHSCDTCTFVKRKYILSLELAAAAAAHLFPNVASRPTRTVAVTLEPADGSVGERVELADYSTLDQSISDVERTMDRKFAVLMHLLNRYDLLKELHPLSPTDWRLLSLTQLRCTLIKLFAARPGSLPLLRAGATGTFGLVGGRPGASMDDLVGDTRVRHVAEGRKGRRSLGAVGGAVRGSQVT